MPNPRTMGRFAEVLLKARLIDELQLKSALAHVERWAGTLPRAIAELGFADEDAVVDALARALRVPAVHLGNVLKDNAALRSLGVDYCDKYHVFPISLKDRTLTLAMADPTDLQVIDDASSMARARVQVVMAAESEIQSAIARHFRGQDVSAAQRKKTSGIRKVAPPQPNEEKLEFERKGPRRPNAQAEEQTYDLPPGPPDFTPEEVRRLEAALQNQEKVGHILRTVQALLADKGLTPKG
ncbi:MAG: hypothetical protein IPJ65_11075 [Archangiaceae bacterium]|nr:hypothetical protein [Archangiaceae bacterium]